MCSRSCTRVFSEPTYGLKVSFVYVYKTRLLLYKATTLQKGSLKGSFEGLWKILDKSLRILKDPWKELCEDPYEDLCNILWGADCKYCSFAWNCWCKNDHNFFLLKLQLSLIETCSILDPVVQRLISANPGLNFNQGMFNSLLKSLFRKICYSFSRASNLQIAD